MSVTISAARTSNQRWLRITLMTVVVLALLLAGSAIAPNTPAIGSVALPPVIPALSQARASDGPGYTLSTSTRIIAGTSERKVAETFAADLQKITGYEIRVVSAPPRPGDITLLQSDIVSNGPEGYLMDISEDISVQSSTDTGLFWGTRTVLQLLGQSETLPATRIMDQPEYADRGIEICPCALKISMERMERLIIELSSLKMNYLLVPMKILSDQFPEVNQYPYYTKEEARELVALASEYHVRLIPEINAPGHMEQYLYDRPDLYLTDKYGRQQIGRIDVTKPEAFEFYTGLIDEYAEIFDEPTWHMGADEYMLFSSYDDYPQIGEYARDKFGPTAEGSDAYIDFINRVNDYVKSKHGMSLRIWNDGLPVANTIAPEPPRPVLSTDITIEHWIESYVSAQGLLDAGYRVTNAAGSWYDDRGGRVTVANYCPPGRLVDCMPSMWENNWTPVDFEPGERVSSPEGVTGAHISLWQSDPAGDTEREMEQYLRMPLRVLAERTWSASEAEISYADFVDRSEQIGDPPGWMDPRTVEPVSQGVYVLDTAAGALAPADNKVVTGASEHLWQLSRTTDGYYQIIDPETDRCLSMRAYGVVELLVSAPNVGRSAELVACSDNNMQKWEISDVDGSAGILINGIDQMPAVLEEDVLRQRPADAAAPLIISYDQRSPLTIDASAEVKLVDAGQAFTVTAQVGNHGETTQQDLSVNLDVPTGWQVDSPQEIDDIAAGGTQVVQFTVTAPADAEPNGDQQLRASIQTPAGVPIVAVTSVQIDPITCADPNGPHPGPNDDFDGTEVDGCIWTRTADPDLETMRVADGSLWITTADTDLVNATNNRIRNLMLQPASKDSWTSEIQVTAPLAEAYQQVGLIAYEDPDNYTLFALTAQNPPGTEPDLYLTLVSEQNGSFRSGGAVNVFELPDSTDDQWWLRLTLDGATLSGSYSADGTTWTSMPDTVLNSNLSDDASVGLFATGPLQNAPVTVGIDYFQLD